MAFIFSSQFSSGEIKGPPKTDLAGAEYVPPSYDLEDLHDDFRG